jgi:hypothetical protein
MFSYSMLTGSKGRVQKAAIAVLNQFLTVLVPIYEDFQRPFGLNIFLYFLHNVSGGFQKPFR